MYVKSIVIDGFKSYGQRTEINGFDQEFNAITGLNGTGKSNILDAICFVLGITNLSHVRAGSLQDLIYKSGQAGINKATVSVTFDNRDRNGSPLGFEDYSEIVVTRQVVLGGKNKYMINGSNVPNKRVQDLFCSVHLNVNNPHFLIMQGRITKVLNMKPPEILSMLEEAAGTRMYEAKRQASLKLLEKKDAKLLELNNILKEEIAPKLQKLKQEREKFLEYQRVERELKYLTGLYTAWQYFVYNKKAKNAKEILKKAEDLEKEMHDKIYNNRNTIQDIDKQIQTIHDSIDTESNAQLAELEEELKQKSKMEAKANATEKEGLENIKREEKNQKQLEKNLKDDEAALAGKVADLTKVEGLFKQLKNDDKMDNEAFAVAQKKFEAVSAGMDVNEDGETSTLQEQLIGAKQDAAEASTGIQQADMQLSHCQKQLKEKQRELGTGTTDYSRDKVACEKMEREVRILESSFGKMSFSEEKMGESQERRRNVVHELRSIKERVDRFEAQHPYTEFRYRDPETNFNRRSVKGLVCNVIKLKDPETCTAIETAAGGRLYNVIVDTDVTSKKLLQRGNLQQRTTIIPLNQIRGGKIDARTYKFAQDLVGAENVHTALSLIDYDKELQVVMEYIFGNVFICRDMNVAKQITFHPNIMRKCVTLEGDVMDPSGTLSGGAMKKSTPILLQLEEMKRLRQQLSVNEEELIKLESLINKMAQDQDVWASKKHQLELKQHEMQLLQQRLKQTTHHQKQEEIENLRQQIAELTEKVKQCKLEYTNKTKLSADLEHKMKDIKGYRDKLLKDAEADMKSMKRKAEASRKLWTQREQEFETLNLEIKELKLGLETIKTQIVTAESKLDKAKRDYELILSSGGDIKEVVASLQKSLKAKKQAVSEKNRDIQKLNKQKEKLTEEISETELEIKKQDHETKKLKSDCQTSVDMEAEYLQRVQGDKKNLEEAKNMGDREGADLGKKLTNAQEIRNKLSRTVNTKAQSLFEQEEKQYTSLVKKRSVVEADKKKIIEVMADLDNKKMVTLQMAHQQVSKDFGSIFSTLLPGTNAKLIPPPGKSVMEGLEVKVGFSGIWKESLSELSGGQRSLVALSLILAMLLFKPAPLYILDEVDAALDLSHTQNVGNMLKAHFKHSQFIIVSLKDGMFSNANVLFRTKFVDGMSAVTRNVNKVGYHEAPNTSNESVIKKKKVH